MWSYICPSAAKIKYSKNDGPSVAEVVVKPRKSEHSLLLYNPFKLLIGWSDANTARSPYRSGHQIEDRALIRGPATQTVQNRPRLIVVIPNPETPHNLALLSTLTHSLAPGLLVLVTGITAAQRLVDH